MASTHLRYLALRGRIRGLLNEPGQPTTLHQRLVDELYRALPHYGTIVLFRLERDTLMPDAVHGLAVEEARPLAEGLPTVVLNSGASLLVADICRDQRARAARENMIGELVVPVIREERAALIFDVQSDRFGALGRDDQQLLEWIAAELTRPANG